MSANNVRWEFKERTGQRGRVLDRIEVVGEKDPCKRVVATLAGMPESIVGEGVDEANGHLLAAAPEMERALRSVLYYLKTCCVEDDGELSPLATGEVVRIEAVLAKANKGRVKHGR